MLKTGKLGKGLVLLLCGILIGTFSLPAKAAQTIAIGTLIDGDYWSFAPLLESFKNELAKLNLGTYEIVYPPESQLNGGFDAKRIKLLADQLQNKSHLQLILTLGTESAKNFAQSSSLRTPVVSMSVDFPLGLGMVDPKNLKPYNPSWTTSYDPTIEATVLASLRSLTRLEKMIFICADFLCSNNAVPQGRAYSMAQIIQGFGQRAEIRVETLVVTPENMLTKLATLQADAAFIGRMYGFNDDQLRQLFATLKTKRIPSFTQDGVRGAELGALAAINDLDFQQIGRNHALKAFDIMQGRNITQISIVDSWKVQLTFNQETTRALDFNIPLEYNYEAKMVGEALKYPELGIEKAVQNTVENNLQMAVMQQKLLQSQYQEKSVRGSYLPHINANVNYSQIDETRSDVIPSPRSQSRVEVELGQVLFNHELNKGYAMAQTGHELHEINLHQTRQNLIQQAIVSYLNVVQSEEIYQARKIQLQNFRKLLDMALLRHKLKETDKNDVLRLSISHENARMELISAEERLYQARLRLNQLLHQPLENIYQLTDVFSTEQFMMEEKVMHKYFSTPRALELSRAFVTDLTLKQSVEVQEIKKAVKLARLEKEKMNSKHLPTLDLGAAWFKQLDDDHRELKTLSLGGAVLLDEKKNYQASNSEGWSAKVKLNLPIFHGGTTYYEAQMAESKYLQLQLQEKQVEENISQNVRSLAFNHYSSRHNVLAAIRNVSRARDSLDLAQASYLHGSIPIVDLLDIQSNLILSEINSIAVRYQFYISLAQLMRTVGNIDLYLKPMDSAEFQEFLSQFDEFIKNYQDPKQK